jgi:hypothetical protein
VTCVDPEHLSSKEWREIAGNPLFRTNVFHASVDKAHLINEWGEEFRVHFRLVGSFLRACLPSSLAISALSATLQPGKPPGSHHGRPILAEGMQPFSIPLAALASANVAAVQPPPRLLIRIKPTLPSIDDIHGSPTLHGIHGTLSFTWLWATSTNCVTDVYAANVHHLRDIASLQPPTIGSPLGECTARLNDTYPSHII